MFRFTLSTVSAVASVGGTATPDDTGITPIPPLNFARELSAAAAESGSSIPSDIAKAGANFIMVNLRSLKN
jgi:hypothetical protein